MAELVPADDRDVYLFVTPPKAQLLHHDEPKVIQCQRIVVSAAPRTTNGAVSPQSAAAAAGQEKRPLRIRPVLNLEFHRFASTKVVELEHDDTKICEFHTQRSGGHRAERAEKAERARLKAKCMSPSNTIAVDDSLANGGGGGSKRGSIDDTSSTSSNSRSHSPSHDGGGGGGREKEKKGRSLSVRRKRRSIGTGLKRSHSVSDRKAAKLGGKVVSTHDRGLEMTVTSWPEEGIFEFVPPGPPSDTLTWRRRTIAGRTEWLLIKPDPADDPTAALINELHRHADGTNGTNGLLPPRPPSMPAIHRSESTGTQYTDILDDAESILSRGDTNASPGPVVNRQSAGGSRNGVARRHDGDGGAETVLSSWPVPHLSHVRDPTAPGQGPRSSMAEVRDRNRRQYRLLVSALWLVWCADDFTAAHSPANGVQQAQLGVSGGVNGSGSPQNAAAESNGDAQMQTVTAAQIGGNGPRARDRSERRRSLPNGASSSHAAATANDTGGRKSGGLWRACAFCR